MFISVKSMDKCPINKGGYKCVIIEEKCGTRIYCDGYWKTRVDNAFNNAEKIASTARRKFGIEPIDGSDKSIPLTVKYLADLIIVDNVIVKDVREFVRNHKNEYNFSEKE